MMTKALNFFSITVLAAMAAVALSAQPAGAAQSFSVQGRILNSNQVPITASNVQFKVQVRSPGVEDCLLYEEIQTLNLQNTDGAFAIVVGDGTRAAANIDGGNPLQKIFSNSQTLSLLVAPAACANAATSYTPFSSSYRVLRLSFDDGSGWDAIPDIPLTWVPQAFYSQDSGLLGGVSASAYVLHSQIPSCGTDEFLTKTVSGTYSCIDPFVINPVIATVSSANSYLTAASSGSAVTLTVNVGSATNTVAAGNDTRLVNALLKSNNLSELSSSATARANLGLGTAALLNVGTAADHIPQLTASGVLPTSVIPSQYLTSNTNISGDVSGTASSLAVVSVGGKTAAQIATSVDDTLAATNLASASTLAKRDGSGGLSLTGLSLNNLYLYNSANYVLLRSSGSLSSNYTLTFPAVLGSSGTVLATDASGQLAWISPTTGSVVAVSATAPLSSTGGVNPVISITQATSSVAGYLAAADFTTFSNKLNAASNLSDLASSATARTNLGLGTAAIYNVGTSANNIVQLDSSSRIPALNGSLLTSLTRANITSGVANAVLINDASGLLSSENSLAVSRGGTAASSFTANSLIMANGTGTAFTSATCSSEEILRWNLVSGSWACTSILNAVSATAFVNGGNSLGASSSVGTADNFDFYLKTNNTNRVVISSAGNVGIGLPAGSSPTSALQVNGVIVPHLDNTYNLGAAAQRYATVYAGSAVINTSDLRAKEIVQDSNLGLEFINQLRPVSYYWKGRKPDSDLHYGLIAQEVEATLKKIISDQDKAPIVSYDKPTDRYGLKYSELVAPLIKSVQELTRELEHVRAENKAIKEYICANSPRAEICK